MKNAWGERLRRLRTHRGLGPYQAAQALNVRWETLKSWETGKHRPLESGRQKIAALYGVDPDTLEPATLSGALSVDTAATGVLNISNGNPTLSPQPPSSPDVPGLESEHDVPDRIRKLCVYLQGYALTHDDLVGALCDHIQKSVDDFITNTTQKRQAAPAPKARRHSGGRH